MSRFIFVQPLFAPDRPRLQRNIDSLLSMSNYIKANKLDVDVALGGWSATDELFDELKVVCTKANFPGLKVFSKFDRNYGKATIVNTLLEKAMVKSSFQYILTSDSDIIFKEDTPRLFDRLQEAIDQIENANRKFGLISLQQEGHCCHLDMVYQNDLKYKSCYGIEERIVWPNGRGGIAGGCICVSRKAWKDVGGYRVMGVYAGDDAYLLIDLVEKGYTIQMFDSLPVIHPHDNDQEYSKWKVKVCQRDSTGGKKKSKIDNEIEEAEKFWSQKGIVK